MSDKKPHNTAPPCPAGDTLWALHIGELQESDLRLVAQHLEECEACSRLLDEFPADGDVVLAELRGTVDATAVIVEDEREAAALLDKLQQRIAPTGGRVVLRGRLGQYQITEPVGAGGMGIVYKARHLLMDRMVALKVIHAEHLQSPQAILRFRREIRTLAQLDHPNIVRAYDADEVDGISFLVMEFVEGLNLAELVRRIGPLPVSVACSYIREAAAGLHHAHDHGVVHRDVKPSNLILTPNGQVKVLDLGLAALAEVGELDDLTSPEDKMGTPGYVAPEQEYAASERADLYSLGCTFYYLLAGRPPEKISEIALPKGPAPESTQPLMHSLRRKRPDVPADVEKILERLLSTAPAQRFASAAEVSDALAPHAAPATTDENSRAAGLVVASRRRRLQRARALGTLTFLLIGLMTAVFAWGRINPAGIKGPSTADAKAPASPAAPLRVESFRVQVFQSEPSRLLGDIGIGPMEATFKNEIRISIRLAEPAYCYLVAFNPDGREQLCYPKNAFGDPPPPERTARVTYPPRSNNPSEQKYFVLDDGPGLQAFVLLSSRQPLLPYREWRAQLGKSPWKHAEGDGTWTFDGRTFVPGAAERGTEQTRIHEPPSVFKELCLFFQHGPAVESVAAVAFPVKEREQPKPKSASTPPEASPVSEEDKPWERVLSAASAAQVQKLQEELRPLEDAGKWAEARVPMRALLKIGDREQGPEHWQNATYRAQLRGLEELAALPPDVQVELAKSHVATKKAREAKKHADAARLCKQELALFKRHLSASHEYVCFLHLQLAEFLNRSGAAADALEAYSGALEVCRQVYGPKNPRVAEALYMLGYLRLQLNQADAESPARQALQIRRELLGEANRQTIESYDLLGRSLYYQQKFVDAEPIFIRMLQLSRALLGEDHEQTAIACSRVATCLYFQGKAAAAEPLCRRALSIFERKGKKTDVRAIKICILLGAALNAQQKYAQAEPVLHDLLARLQAQGTQASVEQATAYHALAESCRGEGKFADAEGYSRKALVIALPVLKDRPERAEMFRTGLALSLMKQAKYQEAEPLLRQAIEFSARVPTGSQDERDLNYLYLTLAKILQGQGKFKDALDAWDTATKNFELARLTSTRAGLERALFAWRSPWTGWAVALARAGRPVEAWQRLEGALARGLREEGAQKAAGNGPRKSVSDPGQRLGEPQRVAAASLTDIQTQLSPATALVAWVDLNLKPGPGDLHGDHWACVVRRTGPPVWIKLHGSDARSWTDDDDRLPEQAYQMLSQRPKAQAAKDDELLRRLYQQRLAPLEPQLGPRDGLPAVKQLLVVSVGAMALVPVEALTDRYTTSYVPSGSMLARLMKERKEVVQKQASPSLLAVGDPVFAPAEQVQEPEGTPPMHGVLVTLVQDGSSAARAGLRAGDVLVVAAGKDLTSAQDLAKFSGESATAPGKDKLVPVRVWRDGRTIDLELRPGAPGVTFSSQSARDAVRAFREANQALQATRDNDMVPLPGTRREVQAIAGLFSQSDVLLDTAACVARLDDLANAQRLRNYRYIHLATHAVPDEQRQLQSALILSRDPSDPLDRVLAGQAISTGRLTAEHVLKTWKLDADLVTLSACQSELGKKSEGEGQVGFVQALLLAGARSLVLSRWRVDDTATTLLMVRFYQNLLGSRPGLREPMPRAQALQEAKAWLRNLSSAEVQRLSADLARDERGSERSHAAPLPLAGDRPYAHPYFWAAFVLIGDPDLS